MSKRSKRSVLPPSICHFPFMCGVVSASAEAFLDRADLLCPNGGMYPCDTSPATHMLIPELLNVPLPAGHFCDFHKHLLHAVATAIEDEMIVPFLAALTKAELQGEFSQLKPFSSELTTSIERKSLCWYEVTLIGSVWNDLFGCHQTEFIDEEITASCYVYGHSEATPEGQAVFLFFPCFGRQYEAPLAEFEGWRPKPLLNQVRADPAYRDGITAT